MTGHDSGSAARWHEACTTAAYVSSIASGSLWTTTASGRSGRICHQLVVQGGQHHRPSPELDQPTVVHPPGAVVLTAVEPVDRRRLLVQQHDLAKVRALVVGDLLEGLDLVDPGQVLGEDHVSTAAQMSRRHRQGDRPQDVVGAVLGVLPATDQPMQAVDVEVEGAGMPVRVESGERGLPDPRRSVQEDQARSPIGR